MRDFRLSVNLPEPILAVIKDIAERRNVTVTEALRQAISTMKFVEDTCQRGGKILLEKDAQYQEVVFR